MEDSTVQAELISIAKEGAVLNINGQQIHWPATALPSGVQVGHRVWVRLHNHAEADTDRAEQARAILAEILGGQS